MNIFHCLFFLHLIFFCEAFSLGNGTAKQLAQGRIIGGSAAWAGQFPYIAAIYKTTQDGTFFCGGALLDNQWILTAGSCVNQIYLGTNNLKDLNSPNTLQLTTDEYEVHPDFDPFTLRNDIGLIKLRMPIQFTMYVRPFNQLAREDLLPGTPGIVNMGWGQTSDNDAGLVDDLQFVYLTPLSNEECQTVYGNQIAEHMVCAAGNNNEGFCLGDTGTPLVSLRQGPTTTHIGIASFVSQNGCESPDPSGFTRTMDFVDWIRNVTGTDK